MESDGISGVERMTRNYWLTFGVILTIYTVVAVALFLHFGLDSHPISVSKTPTVDWKDNPPVDVEGPK